MPLNVREQITLTDSILISKWVGKMSDRPFGWYETFQEAGAANDFQFFNQRNKSIGIMWNNQDQKEQLPFGMRIRSIGVSFFGPACASQFTACHRDADDLPGYEPEEPISTDLVNREELQSPVWEADIPNHASLLLRTNQDDRLKGFCSMFPPGYGPVGGGWGWGSPATWKAENVSPRVADTISCGDHATNVETIQSGVPDIRQRFEFPITLDVPRRANLVVIINLSTYAKELLKSINGPYWFPWVDTAASSTVNAHLEVTKAVKATVFGIQVTINGERLIQQRGDYHV